MPLTSNVYHIGRGINTISQHDRRDHASSCVDSREPYPALRTLVERSEGVSRDADELDEWYHSDALFGFTIATHLDRVVRMGRIEREVVLNCILSMEIYDWKNTDKQGGGSCPVSRLRFRPRFKSLASVTLDSDSSLFPHLTYQHHLTDYQRI